MNLRSFEKITNPTRVQSAAEQPQSTKSPDFTRNFFFLFLLSFPLSLSLVAFAMVIACRTTPNDKKKKRKKGIHTEQGIDLSIQRNCVHVWLPEGGFCVGRTLERIVQRPGELILFRCQLTRRLPAR